MSHIATPANDLSLIAIAQPSHGPSSDEAEEPTHRQLGNDKAEAAGHSTAFVWCMGAFNQHASYALESVQASYLLMRAPVLGLTLLPPFSHSFKTPARIIRLKGIAQVKLRGKRFSFLISFRVAA